MKTKYEILQSHFKDGQYLSEKEIDGYTECAEDAMDEYAKQQAIALLEFAIKSYIRGDMDGNPYIMSVECPEINTPQDVYEKFIIETK